MAKLTEQEQIAPDESAAAEPEIEAVESPEAETEKEPASERRRPATRGAKSVDWQGGCGSTDGGPRNPRRKENNENQ